MIVPKMKKIYSPIYVTVNDSFDKVVRLVSYAEEFTAKGPIPYKCNGFVVRNEVIEWMAENEIEFSYAVSDQATTTKWGKRHFTWEHVLTFFDESHATLFKMTWL